MFETKQWYKANSSSKKDLNEKFFENFCEKSNFTNRQMHETVM